MNGFTYEEIKITGICVGEVLDDLKRAPKIHAESIKVLQKIYDKLEDHKVFLQLLNGAQATHQKERIPRMTQLIETTKNHFRIIGVALKEAVANDLIDENAAQAALDYTRDIAGISKMRLADADKEEYHPTVDQNQLPPGAGRPENTQLPPGHPVDHLPPHPRGAGVIEQTNNAPPKEVMPPEVPQQQPQAEAPKDVKDAPKEAGK